MQDKILNREKTQAILDSRPDNVSIQDALGALAKQGFTIEGYNDKPVQNAASNVAGMAKSFAGGVAEGVGGIGLSAIDYLGNKAVNALPQDFSIGGLTKQQMQQNLANTPSLQEQLKQQMGGNENPNLYGAGQLTGQVASLAAPVGAVGRVAKVGAEALGAGAKTAKLAQAGTEGLAFTAGQSLAEGKSQSLQDYAINAGLNMAIPGAGMVAKSVGENMPARIINSLIKPLQKDFAYGKNPGKSVAELVPPANDFEGLISNISSTLNDVGNRIGSVVNQSQTLKQIDLSYVLKPLDDAIMAASKSPRTNATLLSRLDSVKQDLVDNIKAGIDPQSFKGLVGDLTKWTGNVSDDALVNKSLKQVYGSTRSAMDNVLSKELTPEQFTQYKKDSEAYGNLLSAKNAAEYRDKINERQNLISFGTQNAGLLTGLIAAVSSGGSALPAILAGFTGAAVDKAMATPAFKTRLASLLSKLAPKDVSTFFEKVPTAKSLFTEQQIKDLGGTIKSELNQPKRGFIDFNAEVIPKKKAVTSLEQEAKKYKSAEEFATNSTELTYKNLQENPYSIKAYGKDFNEPVEYYRAGAIRKNGDIWLTDNQAGAQQYSSAGGGTKVGSYIVNSKKPLIIDTAGGKYAKGNIDINKILTKKEIAKGYTNNPDIKQKFIDYAKNNGYDAVQFADSFPDGEGGMRSLVVWDKNRIKTKSQLTDIWNKANKK